MRPRPTSWARVSQMLGLLSQGNGIVSYVFGEGAYAADAIVAGRVVDLPPDKRPCVPTPAALDQYHRQNGQEYGH